MWLRPAWREGRWWDNVYVSMSVRNSPSSSLPFPPRRGERCTRSTHILAAGMTTTLYWGCWGKGFPWDQGLAVQGCCCPWQSLVPPGSIVPTMQRGHGLVSCSGIQEPIKDTTACGRKGLAVLVPARAAVRAQGCPCPPGLHIPPSSSSPTSSNLSPPASPELTSDSRIPARSRGRCGRSPAGRSGGSRIPRGARSPGLMLGPGTALQGTERGDFQPRC